MEDKVLNITSLKRVLLDAMVACSEDTESTATEKLMALTAAIDLFITKMDS